MTPNPSADASILEAADVLEMAALIVAAYVTRNAVTAGDLPALIASVHTSLKEIQHGSAAVETAAPPVPPVSIKKSIGDDFIVCLEDGKKFRTLKRHLFSKYDMTPAQYRAKWGLPNDYPMVAPSYAAERSALAKKVGLGAPGGKASPKRAGKAA